jgi:hypothetical protein
MRRWAWMLVLFAVPALHAQVTNPGVRYVATAPSGACSQQPPVQVLNSSGAIYTCANGTWAVQGGGGGTGNYTLGTTPLVSGTPTPSVAGLTSLGVGSGNQVNIGALGTPTNWNLDTTSPATALASLGSAAPCMAPMVQTVTSAVATITFSSIPATCNNLTITISGENSTANTQTVQMQINTDTGTHYGSNVWFSTFGTTAPASASATNTTTLRMGDLSGTVGINGVINYTLPGYSNNSFQKMFFGQTTLFNSGSSFQESYAGFWNGTAAAINQLIFSSGSGNFQTGTIFSLNGTL